MNQTEGELVDGLLAESAKLRDITLDMRQALQELVREADYILPIIMEMDNLGQTKTAFLRAAIQNARRFA